jgi:hypothetical protein
MPLAMSGDVQELVRVQRMLVLTRVKVRLPMPAAVLTMAAARCDAEVPRG